MELFRQVPSNFFGSAANKFLSKLYLLDGLNFYHWSDIDLGGFRIYIYLRC